MKTAQNLRVLLAVCFIQWCASAVLLADFIQPVAVQVSNGEAALVQKQIR